jgi:diadenosine tetraphosphate (Ap4A) HIT family hydrolase
MSAFELHTQLAADTAFVSDAPLCRVLLMNDANFPWLILVPRRAGLRDYHNLSPHDLDVANNEIVKASRALTALYKPDKINVAALGNVVPQLHIHVIARFTDDVAWPKPVWSVAPERPYTPEALEARLDELRRAIGAA